MKLKLNRINDSALRLTGEKFKTEDFDNLTAFLKQDNLLVPEHEKGDVADNTIICATEDTAIDEGHPLIKKIEDWLKSYYNADSYVEISIEDADKCKSIETFIARTKA